MEAIIRMATMNDIDKLIKVRFDYFSDEKFEIPDGKRQLIESQLPAYFAKHLDVDFFAAFIEIDGNIAAAAFLVISEKPANLSFPTGRIGTFLNVLTYPQYRKMGFATKLLNLLIDEGKRQNLSYIELSASEMGRKLYNKLGFIERDFSMSHFTEMRLPYNIIEPIE